MSLFGRKKGLFLYLLAGVLCLLMEDGSQADSEKGSRHPNLGIFQKLGFLEEDSPISPVLAALPDAKLESLKQINNYYIKKFLAKKNATAVALSIRDLHGRPVLEQFFGKTLQGNPVDGDSVFDLASLTKIYTAISVLQAHQDNTLDIGAPVSKYYPDYHGTVTIEDLLRHRAGLPAGFGGDPLPANIGETIKLILKYLPKATRKNRFVYSDLGYILAGDILAKARQEERIGEVQVKLFNKIGATHTCYSDASCNELKEFFVGNGVEQNNDILVPDDPDAKTFAGMIGSAGIFSSTNDLAKLLQHFFSQKNPLLNDEIQQLMLTMDSNGRAIGWDKGSVYSEPIREPIAPQNFLGHTGYTGTSIGVNLKKGYYVILLTNRTQGPAGDTEDSQQAIAELRAKIYYNVYEYIGI